MLRIPLHSITPKGLARLEDEHTAALGSTTGLLASLKRGVQRTQRQGRAHDAFGLRGRRRHSAHARRRISEAAKKRWAALRAAKKETK